MQDLFNQAFFPGHALGAPISAIMNPWVASTGKLMGAFRKAFPPSALSSPPPERSIHEALVKKMAKTLGSLASVRQRPDDAATGLLRYPILYPKDLEQVHLCCNLSESPSTNPSRYAGYIINALLGGSMSSRLFQEIRKSAGWPIRLFLFVFLRDTGMLVVYAGTTADNVRTVIDLVISEVLKVQGKILERKATWKKPSSNSGETFCCRGKHHHPDEWLAER